MPDLLVAQVYDSLKKINALATNPHWTPDRKYRIADLASECIAGIEKAAPFVKEETLTDVSDTFFFDPRD